MKEENIITTSIKVFIENFLPSVHHERWDIDVWPNVKKFNEMQEKPLDMDVLENIYGSIIADELIKIEEKTSNESEKSIVKIFITNKIKGTFELAKYLTKKFDIITVGENEREMFVYQNGVYRRAENEIIYPEIQRVLGDTTTKSAKTETFHKIADMTSYPRSIFSSAPFEYIPLKNGVYNFVTKQLLPHDAKYRFTYQFPIIYDPKATCPKTNEFMNHIFGDNYLSMMQEWIGYYFYRMYTFKKAVILVGEGDTGKTTFLETLVYLLGKDNISSISLHKMSSDKFSAAHLYEKHGNIVDELSAKDISDTGAFKMATGGGTITGEYKFGNQFSFLNFSKFTFACNKIPDVADFNDEAYFNRWMVIRFNNPILKKIPNFIQTLATEEERSGFFNFAMEGLVRLLKNGSFTYSKSAMDTKTEMMRSGSSIAMFAADKVFQEIGAEITKEDMYIAYTTFCSEEGIAAETIDMFGKKFKFYVAYVSEGLIYDPENPKKRVRGWRNVKVAPTEIEKKIDEDFNTF
jgi:putative DNA primase/helicase